MTTIKTLQKKRILFADFNLDNFNWPRFFNFLLNLLYFAIFIWCITVLKEEERQLFPQDYYHTMYSDYSGKPPRQNCTFLSVCVFSPMWFYLEAARDPTAMFKSRIIQILVHYNTPHFLWRRPGEDKGPLDFWLDIKYEAIAKYLNMPLDFFFWLLKHVKKWGNFKFRVEDIQAKVDAVKHNYRSLEVTIGRRNFILVHIALLLLVSWFIDPCLLIDYYILGPEPQIADLDAHYKAVARHDAQMKAFRDWANKYL